MYYYDLSLAADMQPGSDILDKDCELTLRNRDNSYYGPYSGSVLAWHTPRSIRIKTLQAYLPSVETGGHGVVKINDREYTFNVITQA